MHAPFDKMIVTCGAPAVPQALLSQLVAGGKLVIPVGGEEGQSMLCVTRTPEGEVRSEHGYFSFVPMLGNKAQG
jgi:protein-L-isoaspartate(D-aspartate) O-methyltransferase